jgi:hypothetical protein
MSTPFRLRWGLIVLGGILAEVGLFAVAIPVGLLIGQEPLVYVMPPASFVVLSAAGYWVARRVAARPLVHGTLVGVFAAVVYIIPTLGQDLPFAYTIAHGLKVLGGLAGGYVASRRSLPSRAVEPRAS